MVLGLFNALLPAALFAFAEKEISSGLTSVLNSTVPIMTVILAHFLTDEVLTADRAVGVGVGFAGVLIVLLPTLDSGMASGASRPIAVLLASLFMALAAIYARKYLQGVDPAKTATGMMAHSRHRRIPLTLLFENPAADQATHESLIALAVLGVLRSAIAFLLYYWLIANRGATLPRLSCSLNLLWRSSLRPFSWAPRPMDNHRRYDRHFAVHRHHERFLRQIPSQAPRDQTESTGLRFSSTGIRSAHACNNTPAHTHAGVAFPTQQRAICPLSDCRRLPPVIR